MNQPYRHFRIAWLVKNTLNLFDEVQIKDFC